MTRIGSLFSGYEGLGMAVQQAIGGDIAWVSDIDPGACKILAHRYPDVPNIGDITKVDWAAVEPVDILTGGFPCQDVSAAGKRLGMKPGTRSGLWSHMAYAIDQLRPSLVVAENVRGLLSASAHSDLEPCPWCVGDGEGSPLRALGGVLGDLAGLGYDASWQGLRASDVGAPHGRFRVFVIAWPAEDPNVAACGERRLPAPGQAEGGWARSDAGRRGGAPAADTGRYGLGGHQERHGGQEAGIAASLGDHADGCPVAAADTDHAAHNGERSRSGSRLGGAQAASDSSSNRWDEGRPESTGQLGGPDAAVGGASAHPDPAGVGRRASGWDDGVRAEGLVARYGTWGQYAPAIQRWERLTRPAPAPTEPGKTGQPRLSPAFVEWLMGLPAGHVTRVPGLTRNEQLKALGNGVVPQQAAEALRILLPDVQMECAA